ncbi:6-phosphofructokinase 1 [Candidatus Kryptobacter tengchongensis]|uniref:Pyrophosphate--fructose 6-phosphate 1-phosphotransferase n=1 Tax=Kryptobacter tengchongensis TaxID=1643429 RepID=A0A656D9L5_KRYT1|nr:ATP-dependent 6-phosphofructokinase [Candidatus Kryptobacter tengchongensis]CUS81596.1 6-phosphofructokinase 1 [Candidatus Kryptobacter tengchongensis]CUT02450.1 6-phosphofructokinase 1 [Candidatus Kryptobacter tengchongensis]CUT02498.1 6-phosphofructokinase 1 [Candidatus Kryptobacter tengchongensis]CUT04695.1 6-phosphofructokinase 1 [Candidatus Kryptobacter tengchongensis]CUU06997.1 6-phosphofructokinase 1 [Candidatus Kryptobacter tengchongensis]
MKIGILTGGGDCPGLNAAIRSVVRKALASGHQVVGIKNGWKGLMSLDIIPLDLNNISGILPRGGTILGTSRTNPYKHSDGEKKILENLEKEKIDALVAIGGEDTLSVAYKLYKAGVNVVGIPKTIDNDVRGTDYSIGFDTAVNIAMEAIDRVHTTAESHNRVAVVEVMGRHTGWIALYSGLAGGADVILIPEKPFDIDQVCKIIEKRHARGKNFSIVVVAEGAKFKVEEQVDKDGTLIVQDLRVDEFGHVRLGGIGNLVADQIEKRTGMEARATILGHIQRGGSPTAFDRILATRFGVKAIELINEGRFGVMTALQGNEITEVELYEVVGGLKTVNPELFEIAEVFFG